MQRKLKIESKITNLSLVEKAIDEAVKELGISKVSYGKILVSTMEAVNNAITHGNKMNPEKSVAVVIASKGEQLSIKVEDEGLGFKPDEVPDPTMPENIESCNGRGVYLMKHLADEIKYSKRGNSVTMTFKNILS
jgi:serine/threonine-protein kinase RsbW